MADEIHRPSTPDARRQPSPESRGERPGGLFERFELETDTLPDGRTITYYRWRDTTRPADDDASGPDV